MQRKKPQFTARRAKGYADCFNVLAARCWLKHDLDKELGTTSTTTVDNPTLLVLLHRAAVYCLLLAVIVRHLPCRMHSFAALQLREHRGHGNGARKLSYHLKTTMTCPVGTLIPAL